MILSKLKKINFVDQMYGVSQKLLPVLLIVVIQMLSFYAVVNCESQNFNICKNDSPCCPETPANACDSPSSDTQGEESDDCSKTCYSCISAKNTYIQSENPNWQMNKTFQEPLDLKYKNNAKTNLYTQNISPPIDKDRISSTVLIL